MYFKKIGCLFSNFLTFQPHPWHFKDFQHFLIRKQLCELLLKDLYQENKQMFLI